MYLFDPYYLPDGFADVDVKSDDKHPGEYNRIVPFARFNSETAAPYAFGNTAEREAVIIFNTRTMMTAENTIEYFI